MITNQLQAPVHPILKRQQDCFPALKEVGNEEGLGSSNTDLFEIIDARNLPSSRKSSRSSSRGRSSFSPHSKELTIVTSHSHPTSGIPSSSYATVSLNDGYDEQQCMSGADEDSASGSVTNVQSPSDDIEDETRRFVDASSSFQDSEVRVSLAPCHLIDQCLLRSRRHSSKWIN